MRKNIRTIECRCGDKVYLTGFTNCCDCGRDYSLSGHLLAPRSQWGWETGESVTEIMMADDDYQSARREE